MPEQLNPMLSAKRLNSLLELQLGELRRKITNGVKNLWQDGLLVGQVPPKNRLAELQALVDQEQATVQIAASDPLEGNRIRAQRALRRQAELEQELFGERQETPA